MSSGCVPLASANYEGVPIQACDSCHGSLIHEMDVLHIVERKELVFSQNIQGIAAMIARQARPATYGTGYIGYDEKSILCPSCLDAGPRMTRRFVNIKYPVEIDKCRTCGRVWFDKDELEILQCLFEQEHSFAAHNQTSA